MRTASRLLPVFLIAAGCSRPALPVAPADLPPAESGPVLRVEAAYPGANAKVVADTIAAPIEGQVNGVEGLAALESESRDDGTYILNVRLKPGTDVNEAIVLVQNRVNLAEPQLPDEVRRLGVTVRRDDPDDFPRFWVAVTGPTEALLGDAAWSVRDELLRVPGVRDVQLVGAATTAVRVWLDPQKLEARGLTASDIASALREQRLEVAAGQVGRPPGQVPQFLLAADGANAKPEDVADAVVLRRGGAVVRLKDVGTVERAPRSDEFGRVNDQPAALLAITAGPDEDLAPAVTKALAGLDRFPKEVGRAELFSDLRAPGFALAELRLPDAAGGPRSMAPVVQTVKAIRTLPGSPQCVAFSGSGTNTATILVKPGKEPVSPADVRKIIPDLRDTTVRVSDLSHGRPFPVRIAILDAGGHGQEKLRAAGEAVAKRLAADGFATDPAVSPGPARRHLSLRLAREKMAELGVSALDVAKTLEASFGREAVLNEFGREPSLVVGIEEKFRGDADAIKRLEVRGADGKRVPLGTIADIREELGEPTILRVNRHPAVVVTADVPAGKSLADVAAACLKAAGREVPREFEVSDLSTAKPR